MGPSAYMFQDIVAYDRLIKPEACTAPMGKKALITSALPYANGEIHLGHAASTYLPADATVRFLRMRGVEAYYICASDDFGTPILIQSERESKTPQEYSAYWNRRDLADFEALDISFDMFHSTSSTENVKFAQYVFGRLNQAGHIYRREIIQYYCETDKKFLPDRYVHGTCPNCGAEDQYSDLCEKCSSIPDDILDARCALCGAPPVKRPTTHYFFRLSSFAGPLSDWLDSSPNLQKDVKNYVRSWIKSGLEDWDITRDIPWGVPIPLEEAAGKVLYGWFDNHLAYISTALHFLEERGINGQEFWNSADIYHFIGKDIIYHHYLLLPAVRMGLGSEYKLPDYLPTRGHLTLQSKKISKGRNWYIGLRDFLGEYPADYLRYYLLSITSYSQDDLNFDWDDFATRINSELIGNLGNFVNRSLGFTAKSFGGVVPEPDEMDADDQEARRRISGLAESVGSQMTSNHIDRAIRRVMEFSAFFNQYFQRKEPWRGGPGTASCIYHSVNAAYSIAVALYPFLPGSASKMWAQLGMEGAVSDIPWDSASELGIKPGHRLGSISPIFAKVERAGIESQKARLGKH